MCGIAGILTDDPRPEADLEAAASDMAGTLRHRGPDDDGTFADAEAGVALGFRRLAILDLSPAGSQPMRSPSGRYVMVYNGEVYNFRDLREDLLDADVSFRSETDTEVVLAAFDRWGIRESLSRFVGMFALAVWDTRSRELTLARDRLGIKPLFVHARDGMVAFGSELKALCRAPGFERRLDHDALASYLRHLYVPAPASIYRDTMKLPPGHTLTIPADDPHPLPEPAPYWSLEEVARQGVGNRFGGTEEEAVDRLDDLVRDAVRLRMIADVPVGALFSGGIDSSAVVAAMQETSDRPVKTFTVAFEQSEHDESGAARATAEHLGTDHTELAVGGDDALELVPRLPSMFDEPLANPSQIPTHLVCELARRRVTVGLAGDGGDEVFGGYNRYRYGARLLPALSRVPRAVRRPGAAALRAFSADTWTGVHDRLSPLLPAALRQRLPGPKIRKIADLMDAPDVPGMYRSLLSAWQAPESLLREGRELPRDGLPSPGTVPELLERMMLADQSSYLPDDLLAKVDRASMATSLEVRVPLLDHRIVEFSWRLPPEMKIEDGVTKRVLRRLLERRVPRRLWDRPKVGFTVPLAAWLRGPLEEWARDLLAPDRLRRGGVFRADRVQEMWRRFEEGGTQLAPGIWAITMFEAWREEWDVSTA